MRAIDIRIRHDNNPVITKFIWIKFIPTDTTTESCNKCPNFLEDSILSNLAFSTLSILPFKVISPEFFYLYPVLPSRLLNRLDQIN